MGEKTAYHNTEKKKFHLIFVSWWKEYLTKSSKAFGIWIIIASVWNLVVRTSHSFLPCVVSRCNSVCHCRIVQVILNDRFLVDRNFSLKTENLSDLIQVIVIRLPHFFLWKRWRMSDVKVVSKEHLQMLREENARG